MKAASIMQPNQINVIDLPMPQIENPNQVLIRVKRTGICGSDVHIFKGENPFASYPRVFGHEFVGEVAEVGSAVTDHKVGDHVVGEPIVSCGKCYACRKGRPNVCKQLKVMGVHIQGGCQEYLVMDSSKVHTLRKDIPWNVAILTEPMTIGMQATSRGAVEKDDVVLIMGSGTIGLCNLLAAKAAGAIVITTDIVPEKLEYAKKLGADYVIDVKNEDLKKRILEITDGMGPNVVLDCVCNKQSMEDAVDMVSTAGRVVELGFGPISSEISHVAMMSKEVGLFGTRLQANKFKQAIALVEDNAQLLQDFVTQEYPLDQIEEAFRFSIEHPKDVRKIIVTL